MRLIQRSISPKSQRTMCWYHRVPRFFDLKFHKHVKYELNKNFYYPESYQCLPCNILSTGGHTRTQGSLCLFCRMHQILDLVGPGGSRFHTEFMHPHEILKFVKNLMSIVGLSSKSRAHSVHWPIQLPSLASAQEVRYSEWNLSALQQKQS